MNLTPHETWTIHDATKIQAYMDCPRHYFFDYVLGWRPIEPNVHLEFGSAMHLAMEHLIIHGYDDASILEAYMKLNNYYRQFFSEVQDDIHHPKTPAMGLKALIEYAKEYAHEKFVPLYTEVSGSVSLTDKHTLTFKIDSILSTIDGIKSREHKTGSQLSRQWQDQWALKMQTGVYNHVLYCLFPRDQVWGVEINGIIFSKKNIQFVRVPARRTIESMEAWLWDTIYWCDDIVRDYERLSECSDSDAVMHAFKRNTESCTKYFGCPFHDYCLAWANPLQHCDEPPYGMKVEYWNPKADEKDAKYIFTIKDGMSDIVENKKEEVMVGERTDPT